MPSEAADTINDTLNELSLKVPRTERNPRGAGRKPHGVIEAGVQGAMDVTASKAMAILKAHIEYRRKSYRKLAPELQRACEYVIDHAIGKARQKIEHSGGILTYGALAKEAEKIASKPRDILADAEEIAGKRDRLNEVRDRASEPESPAENVSEPEQGEALTDVSKDIQPDTGIKSEIVPDPGENLAPVVEETTDLKPAPSPRVRSDGPGIIRDSEGNLLYIKAT